MAERTRAGGRKPPLPERDPRPMPKPRRGRAKKAPQRRGRGTAAERPPAKRLESRRKALRRDVEEAPARADL